MYGDAGSIPAGPCMGRNRTKWCERCGAGRWSKARFRVIFWYVGGIRVRAEAVCLDCLSRLQVRDAPELEYRVR